MLNFSREHEAIATLQPVLRLAPGSVLLVILLGIVTALSEGVGLSLFIPLFQSLADESGLADHTFIGRAWSSLFSPFSQEQIQIIAPLAILALLTCKNGLMYLNTVTFSRFNWEISHKLRTRIFDQLLHVDSQFLMEHDAGTLMSTLDKEAWQTTQALSTLATLLVSLCTIVVFAGFLLLISWRMTLLSLLLLVLVSTGVQALTWRVKALGQQAAQANMSFVGQGFEQLSGLETVRQFGRQDFEQQRFDQTSQRVCTTFMELDRLMGAISPISELASATLLIVVLLSILLGGTVDLSVFLTFLFMLYRLSPQVKTLDAARVSLVALSASVRVITDLLETTQQQQISSGNRPFKHLKQGVRFRDVTFQYRQGGLPAVEALSLHILPGQTTAFVGPSGAGKSTIIGLILRRFDPTQGVIEVDGQPLQSYNLDTWWQNIAVVSQNIYLFNTSIRENIAYGRPGASEADVMAAAKQANAHDFISTFPYGYDTVVGERGVRLSGGQRQRLALARCLVRDPEILILDEATNALDSLSENFIQETLAEVRCHRTIILVAHRLSTIEQAEQIFVCDEGRIVEKGDITELLALDGLFRRLYQLQYNHKLARS